MYFLLAILWLVGGVGLLIYQWASGDHRLSFHIGDALFSAGWGMIVLSGYNFLRWWSRRSSRPTMFQAASERRQRIRRLDESRERDPNFIFTDEPPNSSDAMPPRS